MRPTTGRRRAPTCSSSRSSVRCCRRDATSPKRPSSMSSGRPTPRRVALEGPPVGRVAGDDHGLAVADREDREVAGLEAGDDAVRLRVGQLPVDVLVDREQGRGHRDLDVLATAGPLALVERGEDAGQALERGVHVAVGDRVVGVGPAASFALEPGQPALRAHDGGVRPAMGPRAGRAVAGQRGVDQVGVLGGQRLVAQADAVHDAGAEVLQHHVAAPDQLAQDLDGARLAQVERDVALAAVLLREVRGDGVDPRERVAGHVALGRLHLDDVGPHVGQHPPAVGPGEHPGEVEDPHPAQRPLPPADRLRRRH